MSEKISKLIFLSRIIESESDFYKILESLLEYKKVASAIEADPYMFMQHSKIYFYSGNANVLYDFYLTLCDCTNREIFEFVFEKLSSTMGGPATICDGLNSMLFKDVEKCSSIFIPEVCLYNQYVYDLIASNYEKKFYLSVKNEFLNKIYKNLLEFENVQFIDGDIYSENFTSLKFDMIVAFPVMGVRNLSYHGDFISREPSFVAAQNLLLHLKDSGKLNIILPAKIGFGGSDAERLRTFISSFYKVEKITSLPSKVFYPRMSINTYLLSITTGVTEDVIMSKCSYENKKIVEDDVRLFFSDELEKMSNWNVDMAFAVNDDDIQNFKESNVKKGLIKDVADIFRGKAVTNKNRDGNISVVNISDISELGIDYNELERTEDDERKVQRYKLENGDVLISTKGFSIKIAVFEEQSNTVIASSNLCVIRTDKNKLNPTYLKLFLESEAGNKMLKSVQRGTSIVNINFQDISELEIPLPQIDEQNAIADEYKQGLELYIKTLEAAQEAWDAIKNSVNKKLF